MNAMQMALLKAQQVTDDDVKRVASEKRVIEAKRCETRRCSNPVQPGDDSWCPDCLEARRERIL